MYSLALSANDAGVLCARLNELTNGDSVFHVSYQNGELVIGDAFESLAMQLHDAGFLASKSELKSYATVKRQAKETGGIIVDGVITPEDHVAVATDRISRAMLSDLAARARINSELTSNWKTFDNKFIFLDAARIIDLDNVIAGFVARCFDTEAALYASIESGEVTTQDQIDQLIGQI